MSILYPVRTLATGDIHGRKKALASLMRQVQPEAGDRLIFLGDYIDRSSESRAVLDSLLELGKRCSTVFLRGNHEVMILDAREDPLKANLWQSYGGLDTLISYGAEFRDDWAAMIPVSHWAFLERTVRFFETTNHIFAHACLDPNLEMADQPDWMLYWEFFDRIQPHRSGKQIICGHSPQPSGLIKDMGFAACIDTAGWLTCLDVDSRKYWQAKEDGVTRTGSLQV
jgi:serine/threonine protein phosphatase 1